MSSRVAETVRESVPFELSSAMIINRPNKMQQFMGFWQHEPSEGHKIITKKNLKTLVLKQISCLFSLAALNCS